MSTRIRLFAVAMMLAPTLGAAQSVQAFEDLPLRLNIDDRISVVDRAGQETGGRLIVLTQDEIAVRVTNGIGKGSQRRFGRDDVRRIARRGDRLRNGALIGLGAGAALGCTMFINFSGEARFGDCVGPALLVGAVGAGLGVGVDALITGSTLVYDVPASRAAARPIRSRQALGVRVSLRW